MIKIPRFVRQVGKSIVKMNPTLRRSILSSTDYKVLSGVEEARRVQESAKGWLAARTVIRQERAYNRMLSDMQRGEPRIDLTVAAAAVEATAIKRPRLLEVGCGSGYYCEVFTALLGNRIEYVGIDYSAAMIQRAHSRYPQTKFAVADATRLPYEDDAFDIVFNGVSLMHIIDYRTVIAEAARVASRFCILHTMPVFEDHPTTFLTKYAYGAPVVEIIFSKDELMRVLQDAGLAILQVWPCIPYDVVKATGHHSTTETYLCSVAATVG